MRTLQVQVSAADHCTARRKPVGLSFVGTSLRCTSWCALSFLLRVVGALFGVADIRSINRGTNAATCQHCCGQSHIVCRGGHTHTAFCVQPGCLASFSPVVPLCLSLTLLPSLTNIYIHTSCDDKTVAFLEQAAPVISFRKAIKKAAHKEAIDNTDAMFSI